MDATWHSGPRGSATRAHAAPTVYVYLYFIYYIVYKVQPCVYRKGIQLTNPSDLINPTCFTNFFRVGLSPTQLFSFQATWPLEERWIGRNAENPRVDRVGADHRSTITHVSF